MSQQPEPVGHAAQTSVEPLRASQDIAAVLRGKRQRAGRLAVVYAREQEDVGPPRLAVVASRKVGTAVARNRAKRLLREAARTHRWEPGTDVVLVARSGCADSRMPEVANELGRLGDELGVLDGAA